jgi:hypothetical protein
MTAMGRILATTAGVAFATGLAMAADERMGGPEGGSPQRNSGSGSAASGGSCGHQMSGTVKNLDRTSGMLSIDVAGMDDLRIHLPSSELQSFKEGDQVVISLGIREARPGTDASGGAR